MSKSQRVKGARGEREWINAVRQNLGDLFGDIDKQWNQREEKRYDVRLGVFAVEIKRAASVSNRINGWWEEAKRQAEREKLIPLLAFRQDRQTWQHRIAMLDLQWILTAPDILTARDDFNATWRDPMPPWGHNVEFTCTMPMEAFCYLCREYSHVVAR